MNPNSFLRTFWRTELRPTVFVAMSFAPTYSERYSSVIEPAIRSLKVGSRKLSPHRVDISQSGDSILTEIVDGIAHSQLFLADVSSIGKDSVHGRPYRNANVMYEVGIALASRRPEEVLLVRDDHDPFLFDVSTIPHMTLDFTSPDASEVLAKTLRGRLREQALTNDARIALAVSSLTNAEAGLLKAFESVSENHAMSFQLNALSAHWQLGLARLLDKGLIRPVVKVNEAPGYMLTSFGRSAIIAAASLLPAEAPIRLPEEVQPSLDADPPAT